MAGLRVLNGIDIVGSYQIAVVDIPNLPTSIITSGTFADARIAGASNWNTAYTYSQVGHLPLAGGTLTGNLAIEKADSPKITLQDTTNNVKLLMYAQNSNAVIGTYSNHNLGFYTNSTLALTLDTSQNATFAGTITATGGTSTQWNTAYTYSQVGHLPLAGGEMTGQTTHGDSIHTYWGNSNDLDIYHDNTFGSIIRDRGAGDLAIESNQAVRFRKSSTTEVMALMVPDGAVSLYYDNSKKFETTSTGVTVTGVVTATGGTSTQWNTAYGWGNHAGLYLSLGGGTMSGDVDMGGNRITDGVFVTQGGTSDDFVKGDGTLDSTEYLAVTGGTLSGDVTFTGATHHAMWDKSASALEFWDNAKLTFGDPGGTPDLQIYHDGSNSYIKDTGTGNLEILADSLSLLNAAGSEYYARFYTNGSAYLYHNGVAKLNTTSTGVEVTGTADVSSQVLVGTASSIFAENNLRFKSAGAAYIDHNTVGQSIKFRLSNSSSLDVTPLEITPSYLSSTVDMYFGDNDKIRIGAGSDLSIYHNSTNSFIENETGDLYIRNNFQDRDIVLQSDNGGGGIATYIQIDGSTGKVELSHYGTKKFETTSTGATVTGSIQMADDTDTASAGKVGTQRYRTSGSNSYVDMCMQTGSSTYEWINILENNW